MSYIILFFVTILQNASFTLVSRARNSKSMIFHGLAAIASNGIWFIVVNRVVNKDNMVQTGIVYTIAATTGSILMHYFSMKHFEKFFEKYTDEKVIQYFKKVFSLT